MHDSGDNYLDARRVLEGFGNALLGNQDCTQAQTVFQDLVRQYPDRVHTLTGLARAASCLHDWETAATRWRECIVGFPNKIHGDWFQHLEEALLPLGRANEMHELLTTLAETFPDSMTSHIAQAIAARQAGRWEDALNHWDTCLQRFPKAALPWWRKSRQQALLELGRLECAVDELSAKHQSSAAQAYFSLLKQQAQTPAPKPLNFETLLVVTYGRSGSTLLQGILNTIDGVLLRGENENVFYDFFLAHRKLKQLKEKRSGSGILPKQPWYGAGMFSDSLVIERLRETARTILLADHLDDPRIVCYGFKEVRYYMVLDNLLEYFEFLTQLFPNAAFILNTRNLDDVLKSAWWKDCDTEAMRQSLATFEQLSRRYASRRDNWFPITYESIKSNGCELQAMFDFLGADYHPERIDAVLATPHSYAPEQPEVQQLFDNF